MVARQVNRLRRVLVLAAALSLVAGACGTDRPNNASPGDVGGGLSTPTQPGDTRPSDGDGDGSAVTRAGGSRTTSRSSGTSNNKSGDDNGDSGTRADDSDLRAAAASTPGSFAGILLAPGPADSVVIDVLVQQGVSPDDGAVAQLRQILAASSAKPVTVRGPNPLSLTDDVHSAEEIRRLADAQGKPEQGSGVAVIHLLYLRGSYTDEGALGVAVRGDTVAIFPDQIDSAATPFVSSRRIERAVVTHELGHLLGLVDLYLDEGRDDPSHPGHSNNTQSVMYWAVESDLVTQLLDGPPPVDFDGQDQADLRKIHGGAPPA